MGWEQSMKCKGFVFDYVDWMFNKCHTISLNCGGSYIDFPEWIKNKKETNPKR